MSIRFFAEVFSLALLSTFLLSGCSVEDWKEIAEEAAPEKRRIAIGMSQSEVRNRLGDPRHISGGNTMRWEYKFRIRCSHYEDCDYNTKEMTLVFQEGKLEAVYDAPGSVIIEQQSE